MPIIYCNNAACPVKKQHTIKKEACIDFVRPALLNPVDNEPATPHAVEPPAPAAPPAVEQPAVEPPAPAVAEQQAEDAALGTTDWKAIAEGLTTKLNEAKATIEHQNRAIKLFQAAAKPAGKAKKRSGGGGGGVDGFTKKIDDSTKMLVSLIDPNVDTDCTYDFTFCPLKKPGVTFKCYLAYDEGKWVIQVEEPHEKIPNTPLGPFSTVKEFDTAMNVAVRKVFFPMAPDYKSGGSNLLILKGCHAAVRWDEDGNQIDGQVCLQDLYLKTKKE
jgi:hypothetical protein